MDHNCNLTPTDACSLPLALCLIFAVARFALPGAAQAQVEFFDDADDSAVDAQPAAVPVPAPPELKEIEEAFANELVRFEIRAEQRKKALVENYTKALGLLQKRSTDAADLQTAVLTRSEIKRVAAERSPRGKGSQPLTSPELRGMHAKFEQTYLAIEAEMAPGLRALYRERADLIGARTRELTKAGNLDAAMATTKFLESVIAKLPQPPMPKGYDLLYTFEDSTAESKIVKDQSPSGFDAKGNAPGWVASGKRGAGYQILHRTQHLYLDPTPALSEDAFTIATWVNLETFEPYARLWDRYHMRSKAGYTCDFRDGVPILEYFDRRGNRQRCKSSKALTLHHWHHVMFTFDATRCVIYIDGEATANVGTRPMAQGKRHVRVGLEASGGKLRLGGMIDDLIHYPRALSKPDARALYQAVSGAAPEN